ncbi:MAG TPA: TM0106 family RecB-like putative nuclease [Acidimicrobiales bacterium]
MAELLRSEEILACAHRVALNRGGPFDVAASETSSEIARRQRDAELHRLSTLEEIIAYHPDAVTPTGTKDTLELMGQGVELLVRPRLPADVKGRRRAVAHVLVRVGREDERYLYAPIVIKNNEIVEPASTRRLLEGSLALLKPSEATYTDGYGPRSSPTVTRNGIGLAHATRVLQSFGHGDPAGRAAIIDRHRRLWWFELSTKDYPRFNLATYDDAYEERLTLLAAHDQWRNGAGPFPTQPYWHRECPECPYASNCEAQLEEIDDVSLTRYTNIDQQLILHDHGIDTRAQLARLDPERARSARAKTPVPREESRPEDHLGRLIDKLDDLIYRARAHERSSSLRVLPPADMGCPTADVEIDVDMESYDEATYLWGAHVTLNVPVPDIQGGYYAFVEWGELTPRAESEVFAKFWKWFDELRRICRGHGRSFAAYCFWAQAEDGAMNRAVETPVAGGPTREDLDAFRSSRPPQWIDLHEYAKQQIQTTGPLGLKQLATMSGFHWRDQNPSGEASMLWYEVAVSSSEEALRSRQRLFEYNEDDCRATKALRDWLNGPAQSLPHRDDPL